MPSDIMFRDVMLSLPFDPFHYAECHFTTVILGVLMQHMTMLSIIILSVFMMSVIMLIVIILNDFRGFVMNYIMLGSL